jgi:hypothetical protein
MNAMGGLPAAHSFFSQEASRRSRDPLKRDDFSSNHHRALTSCWSMVFSENRYPLFGIML